VHAVANLPYPEPEFSASAFDGLGGVLGVDPVVATPPLSALEPAAPVMPVSGIHEGALGPPAAPETAPTIP
jgi:hypothetical protein